MNPRDQQFLAAFDWEVSTGENQLLCVKCTLPQNDANNVTNCLKRYGIQPASSPAYLAGHVNMALNPEDFKRLAVFPKSLARQEELLNRNGDDELCMNLTVAEQAPALLSKFRENAARSPLSPAQPTSRAGQYLLERSSQNPPRSR